MTSPDAAALKGKRINDAVVDGNGHLVLTFDDGTSCCVEGVGYDGLWTDIIVVWKEQATR